MSKKSIIVLISCQLLILAFALGSYIFNRGDAFSQTYYIEDFTLGAGKIDGDYISVTPASEAGEMLHLTTALDKGVYVVRFNYNTNSEESTIKVSSSELNELELLSAPLTLVPGKLTDALTLDLRRAGDDITISIDYSGEGNLSVSEISIHETSNLYKQNVFYALLLCVILAFGFYFYYAPKDKRSVIMCLGGIFAFSCYPLMTDYMMVGHDLPFHLLRIEGIYHGLIQGNFPVKIHPVWAQDYGYAVGVFYGDAFLYIPAFLRILGFSIQTSYKYFVTFINLGTVIITYFCFKKMFSSTKAGILGSLLYTLSMYRLADVYTRAAIGEYTALMCLPLVLCGFYLIYTQKPSAKRESAKYAVWVALGLTGVIQSHILSCEMLVVFILILCIVLFKRTFRLQTFLTLAAGAGITLLMNLGFLIPFLSYFNESIRINSPEWKESASVFIQDKGMYPVQLFGLMNRVNGGSWSVAAGVHNEAAYSLGIVLTLGTVLCIYLLLCCPESGRDTNRKPAILCCILGLLALFMSSCYFPWDALAATGEVAGTLVGNLQFPWRFLAVATILLTFSSCYAIVNIQKFLPVQTATAIFTSMLTLIIVSCGWYYYDFVYTAEPYRVYDTYELNSMSLYSYEYLPTGTDPIEIAADAILYDEQVNLLSYEKKGTTIVCTAETKGGSTIDFPLNYYQYYACYDLTTGEKLPIEAGYNNMVRVTLPANYSGQFKISFKEPLYWRAAEITSLLTFTAVFVAMCCPAFTWKLNRRKKKTSH